MSRFVITVELEVDDNGLDPVPVDEPAEVAADVEWILSRALANGPTQRDMTVVAVTGKAGTDAGA